MSPCFISGGVTPSSSPWQPHTAGLPLHPTAPHLQHPKLHQVGIQLPCCSPSTGALAQPALFLDTACSQLCHGSPSTDNGTAPQHRATECPGPWDKARLGFSAKTWRRGQCVTCPTVKPESENFIYCSSGSVAAIPGIWYYSGYYFHLC